MFGGLLENEFGGYGTIATPSSVYAESANPANISGHMVASNFARADTTAWDKIMVGVVSGSALGSKNVRVFYRGLSAGVQICRHFAKIGKGDTVLAM